MKVLKCRLGEQKLHFNCNNITILIVSIIETL